MKKPRVRRRVGDIILIPLGEEQYGFGRVLEEPLIAFYSMKSTAQLSIEKIISQPILFRILVMNYAVTRGHWTVIANVPLTDELLEAPAFFKWDGIAERLYITYDGSEEIPATLEECLKLERAAVWDPQHVEERLTIQLSGEKWIDAPGPAEWKQLADFAERCSKRANQ